MEQRGPREPVFLFIKERRRTDVPVAVPKISALPYGGRPQFRPRALAPAHRRASRFPATVVAANRGTSSKSPRLFCRRQRFGDFPASSATGGARFAPRSQCTHRLRNDWLYSQAKRTVPFGTVLFYAFSGITCPCSSEQRPRQRSPPASSRCPHRWRNARHPRTSRSRPASWQHRRCSPPRSR